MSETPTNDWTVAEIDNWAEEQGVEVSGTKPEKLDQIQAHLADQGDEDELPEPEATPPAPEPGVTPEEVEDEPQIPGTVESHDVEDDDGVLRRADGTIRPRVVKPEITGDTSFKTGLGRTSAQFAKRARG